MKKQKKIVLGVIILCIVLGTILFIYLNNSQKTKADQSFGGAYYPIKKLVFDSVIPNTASVSFTADDDIILYDGDIVASLSVGDRIQFTGATDLTADYNYFVTIASTSAGFEVSSASAGTAVNLTTDSVGGETFYRFPTGGVVNATNYVYNSAFISAAEQPTGVIKFVGSIQDTQPDFLASPSATNRWEYVDVNDVATQTSIDGGDGITFAGTADYRMVEIYGNAYKYLSAIFESITSGSYIVEFKSNN